MQTQRNQLLGQGIYSIPEAAMLVGMTARRARDWVVGRNGTGSRRRPVLRSDFRNRGVLSFLDLVELFVVAQFRSKKVSLQSLRRAHEVLVEALDTSHPFSHRMLTDGSRVFVLLEREASSARELVEVLNRQQWFCQVVLPYLKDVSYDEQTKSAKSWKIADGVVIDPAISFGKPIVAACAIPTSVLAASYWANGRDAERVAAWYGVARNDVDDAVAFEQSLARRAA